MTISVLQDRQTSTGGAQISSLALAFSSSLTAGSAIHGLGSSQAATNTFSDNNGNTWPGGTLDTVNDTVGGVTVFHNAAQNCNAGSTTVTISFSAANSFNCIWIREIGGAKSTGNPDGHNIVFSSSTTSQSLSASNTNQPALISALSINSNSQETPVLDASLTASSANPGWDYATGNNGGVAGHKRITSTGSQSITNTQASADALVTVMAIFLEAGGGGATTTAWQPTRPLNPPGASPGKFARFYQSPKSYAVPANVTAALTGQAATFAAGTTAVGTSVAATGQAATFAAGSLAPSASKALTGQAATFSAGTVIPNTAIALAGQGATFAAGLLTPSASIAQSGQSASFAAGGLIPNTAVAVTGQSAMFGAGTMTTGSDVTISLTGQASSFTAGILAASATLALTGGAASFAAGNLLATPTVGLSGQGQTFSAGNLSPSSSAALQGLQASFSAGLLGVVGDVTVALTGQAATFAAGSLTVASIGTGAGPVDSPLMSDGHYRRKKRKKARRAIEQIREALEPQQPVFIPPASLEREIKPAEVPERASLALVANEWIQREMDDEEALQWILRALDEDL